MIHFPCPICRDAVQVSDHLAGLSFQCPSCKATVDIPERSVGEHRTPTRAERIEHEMALPREREWEEGRPAARDFGRGAGDSAAAWTMARLGLAFEMAAALTLMLVQASFAVLRGFLLLAILGALGEARGMDTVLGAAAIGLLVFGGLALALTILARSFLCAAPSRSGVRGFALASNAFVVLTTLLVAGLVLMQIAQPRGPFQPEPPPTLAILTWTAFLFGFLAQLFFLISLNRIGNYFGNRGLSQQAIGFLVFAIVIVIFDLVMSLALPSMRMNFNALRVILICYFGGEIVLGFILALWYFFLVMKARGVIARNVTG